MAIGAWLIRPVSDAWAGSGEVAQQAWASHVPERLAPASAPIKPRTGEP
jgi:hypothetical protein